MSNTFYHYHLAATKQKPILLHKYAFLEFVLFVIDSAAYRQDADGFGLHIV